MPIPQFQNRLREFCLIIHRIDPNRLPVFDRIARVFQSHQRYEFDERQIAVDKIRQLRQPEIVHLGNDYPQFNSDIIASEVIQAEHCLFERAFDLRDSIVVARRIGMKRNAEKDLSLTAFGEFPGIFFVGESTSVRQQVNFGFRQFRTNM